MQHEEREPQLPGEASISARASAPSQSSPRRASSRQDDRRRALRIIERPDSTRPGPARRPRSRPLRVHGHYGGSIGAVITGGLARSVYLSTSLSLSRPRRVSPSRVRPGRNQVITPFRSLVLCAETRREMEEWISALKAAANKEYYDVSWRARGSCARIVLRNASRFARSPERRSSRLSVGPAQLVRHVARATHLLQRVQGGPVR